MDLNLAGTVVVVTGATANIGRAIALEFAAEGAKLIAVGRDQSVLRVAGVSSTKYAFASRAS
jgi:NAD(P)-dependent dehydrogenase (short-subunit alcohol dehydrogenase family)